MSFEEVASVECMDDPDGLVIATKGGLLRTGPGRTRDRHRSVTSR
jgi:hypothetical protein